MASDEMIISIATSLGHLSSRLDQVESNIMSKVETEIRMVKSEFNHLEDKFQSEVVRGDKLYQDGLDHLERHKETDHEKYERHKVSTEEQLDKLFGRVRKMEDRQDNVEKQIHDLEIAPDLEIAKKIKERKSEGWKVAIAVGITAALALLWDIAKDALTSGRGS